MKKGFTLVEILVTLVVVTILFVISGYVVTNIIQDARMSSLEKEAKGVRKAADTLISAQKVPEGTSNYDLLGNNDLTKFINIGKDPWGNNYEQAFALVTKNQRDVTIDVYLKVKNDLCYKLLNGADDLTSGETCLDPYQQEIGGIKLAAPLMDKLLPVKYNVDHWEKADIYANWYDYTNQNWANAVLLRTATSYNVGDTIPIGNIKGFFVWIPRFEYEIWNLTSTDQLGSEQLINIRFIGTGTISAGTAVGQYRTHPGFILGGTQLPGFWVAKFEAGYDGAVVKADAIVNSDTNPEKIIFNPSVYSWTGIFPTNAFNLGKNYDTANSLALNSHLQKNSEWGAVAYLSHSSYGKGNEVFINNSAGPGYAYLTGKSGGSSTASGTVNGTYDYNNAPNGIGASTTGNIYGVYDMNGGAHDIVAAKYENPVGVDPLMDYFTSTSTINACGGFCYGHALTETQYWYKDDKSFVWAGISEWLMRGLTGMHGDLPFTTSGLFASSSLGETDAYNTAGFRVVLTP